MGILEAGTILDWDDNEKARQFVKEKGVEQFIILYNLHKNRSDLPDTLKWGEEIEFNMVKLNESLRSVTPYTNSEEVHLNLQNLENTISTYNNNIKQGDWHFEYGSFMIESVPGLPYSLSLNSIPSLQKSLSYRRWKLETILPPNVVGTTVSALPNLGRLHCTELPNFSFEKRVANSVFLDDSIITNHARFQYLTRNIYKRRKAKVSMLVPLKRDSFTETNINWQNSVEKNTIDRFQLQKLSEYNPNPIKNHIYMDGMGFGMGMSCAQCTYMMSDMDTARYLYDQFTVLSPLWLAMTASTPFLRGMIAATDVRWDALSQSVDCRTSEEMKFIKKSRYASVSLFISDRKELTDHLPELNDLDLPINEEAYYKLINSGVDPIMAKHVAYLFIRDPLVIFKESLKEGTSFYRTHFENIQSTNWNSVRFKPPPSFDNSKSEIGWRVEFRTAELQMTDFENAAFISLITVLVQICIKENLQFYIPISKCDENFNSSYKENAILNEKFWFRNNIEADSQDRTYSLKTLEEIFLGNSENYTGLITRCENFIYTEYKNGNCNRETRDTLFKYFDFISMRIRGQLDTDATFLRKLVKAHPHYKNDSIVPEAAAYDICQLANRVGSLSMQIPEIFGPFTSNFNAGFESFCSKSLKFLNSSSTCEIESSYADSESDYNSNYLRRYLYSCCLNKPECSELLHNHPEEKLESSFDRITSFATTHHSSMENLQTFFKDDQPNIDNSDNETQLNTSTSIPRLRDFVLSEDFTKYWMMRKWLIDSDTSTHYSSTDYDNDFDSHSEASRVQLHSDLNELEYIFRVNELSA